jgi:hypothetical protein
MLESGLVPNFQRLSCDQWQCSHPEKTAHTPICFIILAFLVGTVGLVRLLLDAARETGADLLLHRL